MKKSILTLAMLIIASCTFAQSADYLIKQYRKAKGADYENMTKKIKKQAKKERYINPKYYSESLRINKAEILTVELNASEREALTNNIENIDNYKCLYQQKSNTENLLSNGFTLFPNRQYYGIEENDTIKDGIIRADFRTNGKIKTFILHVTGAVTLEEYMNLMWFEETKNINIKKD